MPFSGYRNRKYRNRIDERRQKIYLYADELYRGEISVVTSAVTDVSPSDSYVCRPVLWRMQRGRKCQGRESRFQ